MAQIFADSIQGCDVVEVFLEDIAAHLRVWPAQIVAIVGSRKGRRDLELMAMNSGIRIRVTYKPGVIMVFTR
jgi:hypothetical protein